MGTTAVIVVAAVVVASCVLGGVLYTRRQRASQPNDQLARAVDDMRERMDALASDLTEALDRADRESRRSRLFGELGGSIDIDEIVDRLLDAAMQITGFDAAMVVSSRTAERPPSARGA